MSKIKICGLKRMEDIECVNVAKPDYAGFVFAGAKRKIDFETAAKFKAALDKEIKAVGVFVNEKIENIERLCKEEIIDLVQLHGDEDEAYIYRLKEKISNPVIRAVRVKSKVDELEIREDYILFDAYSEGEYGGSGKKFDLELIKDFKRPFFIAGGLNRENIEETVRTLNPYCVDISGGVETGGVKDPQKIMETVKKVRAL